VLRSGVESVSFGIAGVAAAPGVAVAAPAVDIALLVQATAESPALLDYFTFIPQALLLLIAVGIRRYLLADEEVPWWLDRAGIGERARGLVPDLSHSVDGRSTTEDAEQSSDGGTSTATDSGQPGDDSTGDTADPGDDSTADETTGRPARGRGPAPDRLALGYENQRVVVGDGDTVDEKIRVMLRTAGEADHTKWIDDGQLQFVRDEHGFTLIAGGDGLTRLNGERLRPGERIRVYPGDEIDLSGVVTLSIEGAELPG
jgi:hypothetical protein